jgi:predicted ArsR family transcriptional regulator
MMRDKMSGLAVAKALSQESSWKILDLLTSNELSLAEIRKSLGASGDSVRVQLERLVDAGMVSVQDRTVGSRKGMRTYALTRVARNVGFPPRDYLSLSESIINSLRDSLGEDAARMLLQDIGFRIGEGAAQSLVSRTGLTKWDPPTYSKHFVAGMLGEMGFQPEVVKLEKRCLVYHERNCLFEDLAVKYPGLVCDVLDRAVHEGIDRMAGTTTTRLKCRGHGDPVCEYSVKWDATKRTRKLDEPGSPRILS